MEPPCAGMVYPVAWDKIFFATVAKKTLRSIKFWSDRGRLGGEWDQHRSVMFEPPSNRHNKVPTQFLLLHHLSVSTPIPVLFSSSSSSASVSLPPFWVPHPDPLLPGHFLISEHLQLSSGPHPSCLPGLPFPEGVLLGSKSTLEEDTWWAERRTSTLLHTRILERGRG